MEQHAKSPATASPNRFGSRGKLLLLLIFVSLFYWTIRSTLRNRQMQKANAETAYQAPKSTSQSSGLGDSGRETNSTTHSEISKANSKEDPNVSPIDGSPDGLHPLDPVLKLAEQIKKRIESDVVDYTATIIKRERIRGKLKDEETMEAKIRQSRSDVQPPNPFAVYLRFVQPSSSAGREVIWVDGQNDGDLLSYQFRIPVKIAPTGTIAMVGNKYPITEIGVLRMVEKLIEKGMRDRGLGDCRVEIFEHQDVNGRDCKLIQVTHPDRDKRFDFHIAQIYIDSELNLPIRYAAYLWPDQLNSAPPLEEEYTYKNLKINVGLTDKDFDPQNPDYRFPQ